MQLVNLKDDSDRVSFSEAIQKGLGRNQGLYFPTEIPKLNNIEQLLELPFVVRSAKILSSLIGDEISESKVTELVQNAFQFGAPLVPVTDNFYCLELFHGPTLAFKDFGARFMAQSLSAVSSGKKITILTATSGDTGAAVAHAFHGIENINVVILYPKGKISLLQEKLFTTLGGNIHTIAIDSDFDACQQLVKDSFDDPDIRDDLNLNSANSINISRLMAQICYYFEAVSQLAKEKREQIVISVPSGNFGNLTAGMIGKAMGLTIKRFIAGTNSNDTVPRYLNSGEWSPNKTVATISNAMDVSQPNNWPRIEALWQFGYLPKEVLSSSMVDEDYTQMAMRHLNKVGYTSEPHAAVAFKCLERELADEEVGIFLGTGHPAKFRETVENVLGQPIPLPPELAAVAGKEILSVDLPADYQQMKSHLLALLG